MAYLVTDKTADQQTPGKNIGYALNKHTHKPGFKPIKFMSLKSVINAECELGGGGVGDVTEDGVEPSNALTSLMSDYC